MRRLTLLLCATLAWTAPAFGVATSPTTATYNVEVLVFETRMPEQEGNELWTQENLKHVDLAGVTAVGETPTASDLAATLRTDPRFRILVHKRWTQAADERSNSAPVLLSTGDRELDGWLRFYVSRFLHVELALDFQPRTAAIPVGAIELPVYQLNEQRRVRSQEIHYFDHPKFGALVRVTPATAR